METRRGDPCGRPSRSRASRRNGTGQARPLHCPRRDHARIRYGTESVPCASARRSPGVETRRGDPCGRPSRSRASRRNGTGQARPLHCPRRDHARIRYGTESVPFHGTNPLAAASARIVGATLVVARPAVVQAAGTGRDKPVPYIARAGTMHEFDPRPMPVRTPRTSRSHEDCRSRWEYSPRWRPPRSCNQSTCRAAAPYR